MRKQARILGFALPLLLLFFCAWWAMRPSSVPSGAASAGTEQALAPAEPPAPAEAPAIGESAPGEGERSAVASAPKPSTGSLAVHVLWGDDHTPAAGVELSLYRNGADELFEQPSLVTDAEGDARFPELAPGRVYVQVRRGETDWGEVQTIVAGEETREQITLEPGLHCKGQVVDARDQPVGEAEVLVAGWAGGEAHVLARTGPDGRFDLRCLATHCHIGARKPGYAASLMRQFTAGKGALAEVKIVLADAAAELSGIVLDPQHQPLAGAVVQAGLDKGGMQKLPDGGVAKAPMPARTRTDAQGRFSFRSLLPGTLPVSVRAQGLAPWSGSAELERGREAKLSVQLEPGVTLRGTVLDAQGAKVAKATLRVGDWGDLGQRSVLSDAEGGYRIEGLATSELKLHAERDGKGTADATLQALAGQELRWDPRLSNGLVLNGRVLDADGKPVEHAMVEGQFENWKKGDDYWGFGNTDKEGRFQFENCVADRPLRVTVRRKGMFPELTVHGVLPGPEELVLSLPKEAWIYIQGRVLGPDDKPLPNVHVSPSKTGAGGSPAETADPQTGAFRYGPYPPGEYQLTLQADSFPRIQVGKRVLAPDEVWDVGTLHFQAGGSLLVHLTRADGKPPGEHSWIQVLDPQGGHVEQIDVQDGVGRAGPFAPGSYLLQIHGADLACRQQQVEVQAGVELRVDLQAQSGLPAEIECTLPGAPDSSAGVQIAVTDAAGVRVLNAVAWSQEGPPKLTLALSPGTYRVDATQGALRGSGVLVVAQSAAQLSVVLGP